MPPRPPISHVAKVTVLWTRTTGSAVNANNIFYVNSPGSTAQIPQADLALIANAVIGTTGPTGLHRFLPSISNSWQIAQVTVSDAGGSTAQTSSAPALLGSSATAPYPPQVAVCTSWAINARYRGGKPRWYVPGIPTNATLTLGDQAITPTYATALQGQANSFLNDINATTVATQLLVLGTVSYFTNKALRPTPLFVPFLTCHIHERLDSQRRRSGKETRFPVS